MAWRSRRRRLSDRLPAVARALRPRRAAVLHLRPYSIIVNGRVDDSFDKYIATIAASFEDVLFVCLRAASTSTSPTPSARLPPATSPTSSTMAWSLAARARSPALPRWRRHVSHCLAAWPRHAPAAWPPRRIGLGGLQVHRAADDDMVLTSMLMVFLYFAFAALARVHSHRVAAGRSARPRARRVHQELIPLRCDANHGGHARAGRLRHDRLQRGLGARTSSDLFAT